MPAVMDKAAKHRLELIRAIEKKRESRVVTYVLSDRRGAQAQIAEDAVRPMYDHLRAIGTTKRIDLFLYSIGGHTEVPWRIATMIRELASEFFVLIPYKAHSAATLISIGADGIVMGPKGELGPIDPQLSIQRGVTPETVVQEMIAVEDIMSYVRFLRETAGLTDQSALVGPLSMLAQKLDPWVLGSINRAHLHIRSVARKLLTSRGDKGKILDEQRMSAIVETLAQKIYQHGHAIGRREAEDLGLEIIRPENSLESEMWQLFEAYEELCKLRSPIDPHTFIPQGQDEHSEALIMGAMESTGMAHHHTAELKGRWRRQPTPNLQLNLNLNLQLPPGVAPQQLPQAAQQTLQQMMQNLQQALPQLIQQEIQRQMPLLGFEGRNQGGAWREVEKWGAGA